MDNGHGQLNNGRYYGSFMLVAQFDSVLVSSHHMIMLPTLQSSSYSHNNGIQDDSELGLGVDIYVGSASP